MDKFQIYWGITQALLFGQNVELNKIVIPTSKKSKIPLKYARVFFYISNLKEACAHARRMAPPNNNDRPERQDRNEYDIILNFIVDHLNMKFKIMSYS